MGNIPKLASIFARQRFALGRLEAFASSYYCCCSFTNDPRGPPTTADPVMYVAGSSPSQPTLHVFLVTSRGVPDRARAVWPAMLHCFPPCRTGTSMCTF